MILYFRTVEDLGAETVRRTEEEHQGLHLAGATSRAVVLDACQTRLRSRTGSIIMANAYRVDMTGILAPTSTTERVLLYLTVNSWTPFTIGQHMALQEVFGSG